MTCFSHENSQYESHCQTDASHEDEEAFWLQGLGEELDGDGDEGAVYVVGGADGAELGVGACFGEVGPEEGVG